MKQSDLCIEIRSNPPLLASVREAVRAYFRSAGVSPEHTEDVVLAVDEACTNAIRHSYQGRHDQIIRLSLGQTRAYIEVVLEDSGAPAPESCRKRIRFHTPRRETVSPGGLGLGLIYAAFDKVEYCPGKPTGNCVTMRLRRP